MSELKSNSSNFLTDCLSPTSPISPSNSSNNSSSTSSLCRSSSSNSLSVNDGKNPDSLSLFISDKEWLQPIIFSVRKLKPIECLNVSVQKKVTIQRNISFPEDWSGSEGCNFVPLQASSAMYKKLVKDFMEAGMRKNFLNFGSNVSPDSVMIHSVIQIENPTLWEDYQVMKRRLALERLREKGLTKDSDYEKLKKDKTIDKVVNEQLLYHGTKPALLTAIARGGFDWRLSGATTGTLYGKGSYFSKTSRYAHDYAKPARDGIRNMFVARVLIGRSVVGTATMRKPDPKDSAVDHLIDPSIFVVFHLSQAYPAYLIKYTAS